MDRPTRGNSSSYVSPVAKRKLFPLDIKTGRPPTPLLISHFNFYRTIIDTCLLLILPLNRYP